MSRFTKTTSDRKVVHGVFADPSGGGPNGSLHLGTGQGQLLTVPVLGPRLSSTAPSRSASLAQQPPAHGAVAIVPPLNAAPPQSPSLYALDLPSQHCVLFTEQSPFLGYMQCMATVPITVDGVVQSTSVWTADLDGAITVRNVLNGEAVNKGKPPIIPPRSQCHVTVLQHCGPYVWAGHSNGELVVYDAAFVAHAAEAGQGKLSRMEVSSVRRHTGSVTCIAVAVMPSTSAELQSSRLPAARTTQAKKSTDPAEVTEALSAKQMILSGSEDFRIVGTQATPNSDGTFPALFSLVGHGTCVRCLFVEGSFVYSGADDGYVRCWSLTERCEVQAGGLPIHAYQQGGVRSLHVHENTVYVAGRGCASMWDVLSGDLLHVFPITSPTAVRAVFVASTLMLWVAGSDGLVFVFDVVACELLTVLSAYKATVLKAFGVTQENHAIVMQVLSNNANNQSSAASQQSATSFETGRARNDFEFYPPEFVSLHNRVHEVRLDIRRIAEATRWQAFNERFFTSLDQSVLHNTIARQEAFVAVSQLLSGVGKWHVWLQSRRNMHRFRVVASLMDKTCQQRLRFQFFTSWLRIVKDLRHRRGRMRLAEQLVNDAQQTVQAVYVRRAVEIQVATNQRAARQKQAEELAARNGRCLFSRIMNLWHRCTEERQLARKHDNIAACLENSVNAWRRSAALKKWIAYAALERKHRRTAKASEIVLRETERVQQILTFAALNRVVQARRHETRRLALCFLLDRQNEVALRRRCFLRLLRHACQRKSEKREAETQRLTERVEELHSYLEDGAVPEEEELDQAIEEVSKEVAEAEKEVHVLEVVIKQLEDAEKRLTAQQKSTPAALAPKGQDASKPAAATRRGSGVHIAEKPAASPPPPPKMSREEIVTTMFLCNASVHQLVGVGFQLRSHWDTLDDTHGVASTRPTATLIKSLERARAGFLPFAKDASMPFKAGGGRWEIDETLLMKSNRITLKKALTGVREVLVAWDHVFNRWVAGGGPVLKDEEDGGAQPQQPNEQPKKGTAASKDDAKSVSTTANNNNNNNNKDQNQNNNKMPSEHEKQPTSPAQKEPTEAQKTSSANCEAAALKVAYELLENTELWRTALEREAQLEYCAQEKESVEVYGGASLPARLQRNASMGNARRVEGPGASGGAATSSTPRGQPAAAPSTGTAAGTRAATPRRTTSGTTTSAKPAAASAKPATPRSTAAAAPPAASSQEVAQEQSNEPKVVEGEEEGARSDPPPKPTPAPRPKAAAATRTTSQPASTRQPLLVRRTTAPGGATATPKTTTATTGSSPRTAATAASAAGNRRPSATGGAAASSAAAPNATATTTTRRSSAAEPPAATAPRKLVVRRVAPPGGAPSSGAATPRLRQ